MIRGPQNIPFAQSSTSEQVPPPYHFPGVTVNAFVWPVDIARVQAYCDQTFNLGTEEERGFTYRPAPMWPYATLLFLDYPVMLSSNPLPQDVGGLPYSDRGIISQTEVFIALPVIRYGTNVRTLITQSTLEWALPFIVVGNPMSSVCGREMLGLGKLLADIETGEGWYPDSFTGTIKLPGWPSLEPNVQMENMEFVSVKTNPVLPTFRTTGSPQASMATLFESREASVAIEEIANISNFINDASLGMIPTNMRTVGLKQYRDAVDVERAIYQSIVTCRARYSNLEQFKIYDETDVHIEFNDTGSFNEILQVFLEVGDTPSNQPFTVKPTAGYRFMADIDFDEMHVIHSFAIDRDNDLPPIPSQSDLTARWARPIKGFFGPMTHPARNPDLEEW
ncbi:acetoacetate decarboxylase family protein [Erythrobacter mangrovi]|uniref:Uncharacterized protein n=1 Tax=Erythrobacter mangrovi TaxID=2739433 RepID=A0A7D3XDV0_9SPHN|nr:hypothetical protein [Erythrobacter mangrovi]QKG72560.1 hypothetical protein HQR01_14970 [Erythrobacter mangrovi]